VEKIFFPIIKRINKEKVDALEKILSIIEPGDELISYISSSGGELEDMSSIYRTIEKLPIKTIAYAGKKVYSSAAIIYLSYNERVAFEDSKFIIHEFIPEKGKSRTKEFKAFELEVFKFMVEKMQKILLKDLQIIARKGLAFSAKEALKIGLINKIIERPTSFEEFKMLIG
jgi:ATP-dependent protease ClpP protease subunit